MTEDKIFTFTVYADDPLEDLSNILILFSDTVSKPNNTCNEKSSNFINFGIGNFFITKAHSKIS